MVYEENKDNSSYGLGRFIASVVKPPPLLFHYIQPSNYTLIQADKWSQNGQSLDIILQIKTRTNFLQRCIQYFSKIEKLYSLYSIHYIGS
jgi:hypothetical protein